MAKYRTITVKADLTSDILVPAALVTELPAASARISDEKIPAKATVSGSQIAAAASVVNATIGATAEVTTRVVGGGAPVYTGSYEVTPTMELQTLGTKDKVMTDNVRIKKIPMYEATNLSGGTTVYIAMGEG